MDNTFYKNNLFEDYTSVELNPNYLYQKKTAKFVLVLTSLLHSEFGKKFPGSTGCDTQHIFFLTVNILYAQATGGATGQSFPQARNGFTLWPRSRAQLDATPTNMHAA